MSEENHDSETALLEVCCVRKMSPLKLRTAPPLNRSCTPSRDCYQNYGSLPKFRPKAESVLHIRSFFTPFQIFCFHFTRNIVSPGHIITHNRIELNFFIVYSGAEFDILILSYFTRIWICSAVTPKKPVFNLLLSAALFAPRDVLIFYQNAK